MIVRIFRAVWFVSLLGVFGVLMYTYASLPQNVAYWQNHFQLLYVSRDSYFYGVMLFVALVNLLPFLLAKGGFKNVFFKSWFHGWIITINLFICVGMAFMVVFNSSESFDFSKIYFIVYGSVIWVCLWTAVWPFYRIFTSILTRS